MFICIVKVSHSLVSNSLWPHGLQPARLLCPRNSSGKNTWVGFDSLLQGIFLTQGSKPSLLHCRQILCCLSPREAQKGEMLYISEGYFWMRLTFEPVNWVKKKKKKKITLNKAGGVSSKLFRAWIEQKDEGRVNLLLAWTGIPLLLPLAISMPGSQTFRLRLNYTTDFLFCTLQVADSGTSWPP